MTHGGFQPGIGFLRFPGINQGADFLTEIPDVLQTLRSVVHQQGIHRYLEIVRQQGQEGNIRHGSAVLPFAHGLGGDIEAFSKGFLGQVLLFPEFSEIAAKVHGQILSGKH